jgi:curved DNA-binding protein CbpA
MEVAARGRDRGQLWSQIGGQNVALRMVGDSPLAAEALAGIAPRLQALLARFVKARRAGDLIEDDAAGLETLRDLARLSVVGLLARADVEVERAHAALSDRSKDLFLRRIAGELERKPLRLNSDDHRRKVIELLRNVGVSTHYELLRVDRHADEQAIHQGYVELASLAHPLHAEKLGLEGKGAALDLLFEAATEAYLVLSHPDRRRAYDRDLSPDPGGGPASEERRKEKAGIAREMYGRARRLAMEHEFHAVLELMQQAVQLDPKAEYYALMGQIQRRNPQWKAGAISSYRDAVRCRPNDADLRFAFALILEEMGDRKQAGVQYRAALELRPNDPKLAEALDLLENPPKVSKKAAKSGGKGGAKGGGGMFPTLRALFRRGERGESASSRDDELEASVRQAVEGKRGKAGAKVDSSDPGESYDLDID